MGLQQLKPAMVAHKKLLSDKIVRASTGGKNAETQRRIDIKDTVINNFELNIQ